MLRLCWIVSLYPKFQRISKGMARKLLQLKVRNLLQVAKPLCYGIPWCFVDLYLSLLGQSLLRGKTAKNLKARL